MEESQIYFCPCLRLHKPKKMASLLHKRQVKLQEFLRSLEKQRDCWNSWRPCCLVEQYQTKNLPLFLVFFWKGGGVVLPTYLALSCIVAISLLIKQYLLWDRKRFDSKWLLERKYRKLYGHQRKEQPKKHRPTALKQNVWNGCCCSILFIFY